MSPPNAYTASFSSFTLQHILFSAQQFNPLKLFIYLLTFSLIYWLSSPPCCKLNDCQELFCPVTWSPELRAVYSQRARVLCSVAPVAPSLPGLSGLWPARPSACGFSRPAYQDSLDCGLPGPLPMASPGQLTGTLWTVACQAPCPWVLQAQLTGTLWTVACQALCPWVLQARVLW